MLGTIDIKLRPLRFAFLVDPGNAQQAREAIRLASTIWGGAYCPIITLHKRMPKTWRDPIKVPPAKSVVLGNLDAFDPDVLVQLSVQVGKRTTANAGLLFKFAVGISAASHASGALLVRQSVVFTWGKHRVDGAEMALTRPEGQWQVLSRSIPPLFC